jgi:predicted nucleotidyltransferase
VGGLAVSTRFEPRFTRDIDLAIAVENDHEAEALVRELLNSGYTHVASMEQTAVDRLATIRVAATASGQAGVVVDLLFASSGLEPEIVQEAELLEVFPKLVLQVASCSALIATKVLAREPRRRPQDDVDLCQLISAASHADLKRARALLAIATARGFHRDKQLDAEFDEVVARFGK